MKAIIRKLRFLSVLLAGLSLISADPSSAQTFTNIHNFTGTYTGGPGGNSPQAGVILSGDTLYGTAYGGGGSIRGTVYKVKTDGTGFAVLHSFSSIGGQFNSNTDGANPSGNLILSGNVLYGTAESGGNEGTGTIFAVNTDGSAFAVLHHFVARSFDSPYANVGGAYPNGSLVLSGSTLYGVARAGGNAGMGTAFKVDINGTGFAVLHDFTGGAGGWTPYAGMVLSGNALYGTTIYGDGSGGGSGGTVFTVNTDGTGFAVLHSFSGTPPPNYFNDDGATLYGGLVLAGNFLYGTARDGGHAGFGTVFTLHTDGTQFSTLHHFTGGGDGANPFAGMVISGATLSGTANAGGSVNSGVVFSLKTSGANFKTQYNFSATPGYPPTNLDGAHPIGGLFVSGSTLFGTAFSGGSSGNGTVYSLTLPPQLSLSTGGGNMVMSWPTSDAGFTLESTTDLTSPVTWNPVSPAPTVVGEQNTVTKAISGPQNFYRLTR